MGLSFQTGRLAPKEQDVWESMSPAIATLIDGGRPVAAAALIDDSGLFVASKNAVLGDTIQAKLSNGELVKMTQVARNGATGLVLLKAEDWKAIPDAKPFKAPLTNERPGARLFAVLGTGPIRASFVSSKLYGVLPKSRRVVPMCEFRFEAPAELIGSAIIICEDGEILGALNATLRRQDSGLQQPQNAVQGFTGQGNALNGLTRQTQNLAQQNSIGPSEMTVAYTVGPDLVRQVIEGFRSPDHKVELPSLGVLCTDAPDRGATIQKVIPGSAAAKADLRVGDVIREIAGEAIVNQIQFSKEMLKHRVGSRIAIKISRGSLMIVREIQVGVETESAAF